jgi:integrase
VRKTKSRGSVFFDKRRDCWMGYIATGRTVNGTRQRRSVRGTTEGEARHKLREIEAELILGKPIADGTMRLAPFLREWLSTTIEPNCLSVNTAASYRGIVEHHLIPSLGKLRLRDITVLDVDHLLHEKYEAGLSGSTVQRIRMILVKALRHAERRDLVHRNVAALTDLRRTQRREGRSLTPEQARALLKTSESHRLGITVHLGLYLGLRPGEVLGLQWSDIDLEARTLSVRRSLKRENNQLRLGPPKTAGSVRTLKMSEQLTSALRHHLSEQHRRKEVACELWRDYGLVIPTEVGTPIDPSNARRALNEMCEQAGIGHWSPNELRHSFASLMSLAGAPMEEVADAMGHVDTRMTSQVYRHNLKSVVDVAETRLTHLLSLDEIAEFHEG